MRPSPSSSVPFVALLAGVGLWSAPAAAFPTMIRHAYRSCAQCHVDPTGAGALTDYGRAQSEILVRQTWGRPMEEDPGKKADFLFGAVTLPEQLELQADVRALVIPEPGNVRGVLMQADLRAALDVGPLLAYASAGPAMGAEAAWITSNPGGINLVSREYWLGAELAKGVLVRAGRMNLPFGIRTENHIQFVRSATRTDINDGQQVGLAASYGSKTLRGEVMGIAGNFQVAPDDFRERGYSAYVAYAPTKRVELGVSSLYTHAALDVETLAERTRQAHGVFARVSPLDTVAVLAEADALVDGGFDAAGAATSALGGAGLLEVDWEPIQGIHGKATLEHCDRDFADGDAGNLRYGGAAVWFFAPRLDLRLDALHGSLYCTTGAEPTFLGLAQLHALL